MRTYVLSVLLLSSACAPPEQNVSGPPSPEVQSHAPKTPVVLKTLAEGVKLKQSVKGFIARVDLGTNHALDIFEHDNGVVSYAQLGGPGVRPLTMEGFDNLSPRDVFEVFSPGRKLPVALEKYPRTNAPRAGLVAELNQQPLLTNQNRSGPASPGAPCPWEFFRDTTTALGPLCVPMGTNYETSNCWQGAGFVDWQQHQNDNALGSTCATELWTQFNVYITDWDNPWAIYFVEPGYWVQWKVTGSCHREWWPPGRVCDAPSVRFKINGWAHMSVGFDTFWD